MFFAGEPRGGALSRLGFGPRPEGGADVPPGHVRGGCAVCVPARWSGGGADEPSASNRRRKGPAPLREDGAFKTTPRISLILIFIIFVIIFSRSNVRSVELDSVVGMGARSSTWTQPPSWVGVSHSGIYIHTCA